MTPTRFTSSAKQFTHFRPVVIQSALSGKSAGGRQGGFQVGNGRFLKKDEVPAVKVFAGILASATRRRRRYRGATPMARTKQNSAD